MSTFAKLKQTIIEKSLSLKDRTVFRYTLIGIINTVFGFSFFPFFYWLFHDKLEINVLVTLSHLCCVALSFFLHKYFTFQTGNSIHLEGGKFIVSQSITWTINIILLNAALKWLGGDPFVLQMLISVLITVGNYFVYKHFVFLKKKRPVT